MQWKNRNKNQGIITLLAVLIVTTVAVAIVVSILFTGMASSQSSLQQTSALHARMYANACAEEALEQLRQAGVGVSVAADDDTFDGNLSFTREAHGEDGTCEFDVIDIGNEERTITASGTANGHVRNLEIEVGGILTEISIDSWQEVSSL